MCHCFINYRSYSQPFLALSKSDGSIQKDTMRTRRDHGKGVAAAICLTLLAQVHPARAATKKTTEVVTSTLLVPSVSTADGEHIHASVVSVDSGASLTTLNLRCVNDNDGGDADATACAGGIFEDCLFVYGPATVSVELDDRDWGCAATSTASPTCSAESASLATTTTITDDAWSTPVTITSGVQKLRTNDGGRTRVVVVTQDGSPVTSTITERPGETGSPGSGATPIPEADNNAALCRRKVSGHGSSGGDGVEGSTGGTDEDGTDNNRGGGGGDPCSSASRSGINSIIICTISIISVLGIAVS